MLAKVPPVEKIIHEMISILGYFPSGFRLHPASDFRELHFIFSKTGIIFRIRFGRFNQDMRIMKPRSQFSCKEKSSGHAHRSTGIHLIALVKYFCFNAFRGAISAEAMRSDAMDDVSSPVL